MQTNKKGTAFLNSAIPFVPTLFFSLKGAESGDSTL